MTAFLNAKMNNNPRRANGTMRNKYRARMRAMGGECGISHGRLGPIHYDEPSDVKHPLSFVIDEILPVSRWHEFGYASARAAAEDWTSLQPAHYICNQLKSNRMPGDGLKNRTVPVYQKLAAIDGDW